MQEEVTVMLWKMLLCIGVGYLSGSVLFCPLAARLLGKKDISAQSPDGNPGTANAFVYGGVWCGILTLVGDLAKGILPVVLYRALGGNFDTCPPLSAWVLAAPVIGHAYPVFFEFRGGKAIAVSFGCLLGLAPNLAPALILAAVFVALSLLLRISPHFYRTLATYILSFFIMIFWSVRFGGSPGVLSGFALVSATVMLKLFTSREEKDRLKVRLLWMH